MHIKEINNLQEQVQLRHSRNSQRWSAVPQEAQLSAQINIKTNKIKNKFNLMSKPSISLILTSNNQTNSKSLTNNNLPNSKNLQLRHNKILKIRELLLIVKPLL